MRIAPEDFGDLGGSSTAVTFWNDVLDWLKKPNHTATNIAESFELDSAFKLKEYAPEAPDSLYAAAAYWFEAADAHNRLNDTERGWSALLMSNFYLGMASGSKSPLEMAVSGGAKRRERVEPFLLDFFPELLKWLAALPDHEFKSIDIVIDKILPQAEEFRAQWKLEPVGDKKPTSWYSSELRAYIKRLRKRHDAVGEQVTTVFARKIKGTPRGPKRRTKI